MSSSTKKILLIITSIVLIVTILYLYEQQYNPKYRWIENYNYDNNQPYGLKLFYDLLAASHSKKDLTLVDSPPIKFLSGTDTSSLYIFVGASFITDSATSLKFMDFVRKGNVVFLSSVKADHHFFQYLTDDKCLSVQYEHYSDTIAYIRFFQNTGEDSIFTFDYKIEKKLVDHRWYGLNKTLFADTFATFGFEKITNLNNDLIDCYKVKYGKGWFVFHKNPILFTNYNLRQKIGLSYANRIFEKFTRTKIYWDEYSKSPAKTTEKDQESPLRFILSERSLKWSWYLLCLFLLLFVVFNAKRHQSYIPLLPSNVNTTIEYINSIASLHYQNNSQIFLADEILRQFLTFIKHKYNISPHLDRQQMIKVLALRSGIPEEKISILFRRHSEVRYSTVPEIKDFFEFYKLTEYFYQNCK